MEFIYFLSPINVTISCSSQQCNMQGVVGSGKPVPISTLHLTRIQFNSSVPKSNQRLICRFNFSRINRKVQPNRYVHDTGNCSRVKLGCFGMMLTSTALTAESSMCNYINQINWRWDPYRVGNFDNPIAPDSSRAPQSQVWKVRKSTVCSSLSRNKQCARQSDQYEASGRLSQSENTTHCTQ